MLRRIGGTERLRNDEVSRRKTEENEHEKLGRPPVQQALEHRYRAVPEWRLLCYTRIDGQRATERHANEHNSSNRREPADRLKRDRRLITERAEIIDARKAHHPKPEALVFGRLQHFGRWRKLPRIDEVHRIGHWLRGRRLTRTRRGYGAE